MHSSHSQTKHKAISFSSHQPYIINVDICDRYRYIPRYKALLFACNTTTSPSLLLVPSTLFPPRLFLYFTLFLEGSKTSSENLTFFFPAAASRPPTKTHQKKSTEYTDPIELRAFPCEEIEKRVPEETEGLMGEAPLSFSRAIWVESVRAFRRNAKRIRLQPIAAII